MNIPKGKTKIAGIGSALMDYCVRTSDEFLSTVSEAQKGGMVMVDHTVIDGAVARSGIAPSLVSGGSACNTIVGVGRLGGAARFVGKRGDDELGRMQEEALTRAGVDPVLIKSPSATGRVLSIITPDAQRSMLTCLGASSEIQPEEIKASYFEDCAVVHIEGYLLFNPDVFKAAIRAAKTAGALVSLDLASYTVVEASRDLLEETINAGQVDILIGNEDEAAAFTGVKDDAAKAAGVLGERVQIAVMNMGKRGSVIMRGGAATNVPVHKECVPTDTTGAGDLWIAGFLYGLVNGYNTEKCGRIAAACGYEVCQVVGAHIPEEGWARIRKMF